MHIAQFTRDIAVAAHCHWHCLLQFLFLYSHFLSHCISVPLLRWAQVSFSFHSLFLFHRFVPFSFLASIFFFPLRLIYLNLARALVIVFVIVIALTRNQCRASAFTFCMLWIMFLLQLKVIYSEIIRFMMLFFSLPLLLFVLLFIWPIFKLNMLIFWMPAKPFNACFTKMKWHCNHIHILWFFSSCYCIELLTTLEIENKAMKLDYIYINVTTFQVVKMRQNVVYEWMALNEWLLQANLKLNIDTQWIWKYNRRPAHLCQLKTRDELK